MKRVVNKSAGVVANCCALVNVTACLDPEKLPNDKGFGDRRLPICYEQWVFPCSAGLEPATPQLKCSPRGIRSTKLAIYPKTLYVNCASDK